MSFPVTSERVKAIRIEKECGLDQAKRIAEKEAALTELETLQISGELRYFLRCLINATM